MSAPTSARRLLWLRAAAQDRLRTDGRAVYLLGAGRPLSLRADHRIIDGLRREGLLIIPRPERVPAGSRVPVRVSAAGAQALACEQA